MYTSSHVHIYVYMFEQQSYVLVARLWWHWGFFFYCSSKQSNSEQQQNNRKQIQWPRSKFAMCSLTVRKLQWWMNWWLNKSKESGFMPFWKLGQKWNDTTTWDKSEMTSNALIYCTRYIRMALNALTLSTIGSFDMRKTAYDD